MDCRYTGSIQRLDTVLLPAGSATVMEFDMVALRRMIETLGALGGTDEERRQVALQSAKTRVQDVKQFNVSLWHPVRLVYHQTFSAHLNILPPVDIRLSGGDVWLNCRKLDGAFPNKTLRSGHPQNEVQELHRIWASPAHGEIGRCYSNTWEIKPADAARVAKDLQRLLKKARKRGEDIKGLQSDLAEAEQRSGKIGLKSPIASSSEQSTEHSHVCLTYEHATGRVSLKLPEARVFVVCPDQQFPESKNDEVNVDFEGVCTSRVR